MDGRMNDSRPRAKIDMGSGVVCCVLNAEGRVGFAHTHMHMRGTEGIKMRTRRVKYTMHIYTLLIANATPTRKEKHTARKR